MNTIIAQIVGGLVLFIYAISQLSNILEKVFTEQAKQAIEKYTQNIFFSLLIGTVVTIMLGSSSAVIILAIVFINAKTLSFKQAIGIIMGANIGTTFSSQLISLNIGKYAFIPLALGLFAHLFSTQTYQKQIGAVMLYLGMLFFGLFIIEEAVSPLHNNARFIEWLNGIGNNHYQGALLGGLITLILQSSSATVGLAIVLGKQNLLSITAGIAVMMGAELGTCSDTLLATIKGSRQAIKAGIFHFIFNLISILIGLLFFPVFVYLITYLSSKQDIAQQIANAHMIFNTLGVLICLPFVGLFEKLLNYLLPDKAKVSV